MRGLTLLTWAVAFAICELCSIVQVVSAQGKLRGEGEIFSTAKDKGEDKEDKDTGKGKGKGKGKKKKKKTKVTVANECEDGTARVSVGYLDKKGRFKTKNARLAIGKGKKLIKKLEVESFFLFAVTDSFIWKGNSTELCNTSATTMEVCAREIAVNLEEKSFRFDLVCDGDNANGEPLLPDEGTTPSEPTTNPTSSPTSSTSSPTQRPTAPPTMNPTASPSSPPTIAPTRRPTTQPSMSPTTLTPTSSPTESRPTVSPTPGVTAFSFLN